jgi:hypothetical protein
VSFTVNPPAGGSTDPSATTWYDDATVLPILATNSPGYAFSTWTSSSESITFVDPSSVSTTATIRGTGTITATFAQIPSVTVTGAYHGARLEWNDVGALRYNIYYSLSSDVDTAKLYTTAPVSGTSYDVKNLPDATWDRTCYYWVAPVGSGGEAPKSSWGSGSDKVWIYKIEITSVTVVKQIAGDVEVHVEYRGRYLGSEGIIVDIQIGEYLGPGTADDVPSRPISIVSSRPIVLLSFTSTGALSFESSSGEFVSRSSYKAWVFLWNQLPSEPGYWEPYADKAELIPITVP